MNILYCDISITKSWHCSGRTTILQSFELPQKFHKIMTMKKYLVKKYNLWRFSKSFELPQRCHKIMTVSQHSVWEIQLLEDLYKILSCHKYVAKAWQCHGNRNFFWIMQRSFLDVKVFLSSNQTSIKYYQIFSHFSCVIFHEVISSLKCNSSFK